MYCLVTCFVLWFLPLLYFVYLLFLDISECLNSSSCHSNATFKNSEGNYTCTCMSGDSGNGSVCTALFGICLNIICILNIEQLHGNFAETYLVPY